MLDNASEIKQSMFSTAQELWPLNRSLTGDGVRQTLAVLKKVCPELIEKSVPSGTTVFDWTVPDEWNVSKAYVEDSVGNRIIDFNKNNLHLVGYSAPVDDWYELAELQQHLHSLPDNPSAIPYVTSYYSRGWGFCITHEARQLLTEGRYKVVIDSELRPGVLNYGELYIPSTESSREDIFLSTYICHPSMANNEISGPVVTSELARWISSLPRRKYNYRIVFVPETIGSLVYISRNLSDLKERVVGGFNITCVGDERAYSYLPSRNGISLSDLVAQHVLGAIDANYVRYSWIDRGSDERQYCAPGVDLPVASMMRSKYGCYPEYHTSLDKLGTVVTPEGLYGGFYAHFRAIEAIENNCYPKAVFKGEPQLGKRGLYNNSTQSGPGNAKALLDLLTYADGKNSLINISDFIGEPVWNMYERIAVLQEAGLISV